MEPFLSRDGRWLFFNNLNDGSVDTNLHYAERIDAVTFEYRGLLGGVNTSALEGVPTMDLDGNFYFVSPRSYSETLSTLYRGHFADGQLSDIALVGGVSRKTLGIVNFDIEVSPDGNTLYFVDGRFDGGDVPRSRGCPTAATSCDGSTLARSSMPPASRRMGVSCSSPEESPSARPREWAPSRTSSRHPHSLPMSTHSISG